MFVSDKRDMKAENTMGVAGAQRQRLYSEQVGQENSKKAIDRTIGYAKGK